MSRSLLSSLALSVFFGLPEHASAAPQDQGKGESPEVSESVLDDLDKLPTIDRPVFRLRGDDGPLTGKVQYHYELYLPPNSKRVFRKGTANANPTLTLTDLKETEGRLRLWVEWDDGKDHFETGYVAVSFARRVKPTSRPLSISLNRGQIVTGRGVSTGETKAVGGIRIAPLLRGQHGYSYPDWEEAVETNSTGHYRLTSGRSLGGVAAGDASGELTRSTFKDGTSDAKQDTAKRTTVLKLAPRKTYRLKVIDSNG